MAADDGLISMTPTSIAFSGTSASINADGGVDLNAITSISLNNVFTTYYENYKIILILTVSTATSCEFRYRLSGTDASGSDYTRQYLKADNTSVSAARGTGSSAGTTDLDTNTNGLELHIYGPSLARATIDRNVNVGSPSGARIVDRANHHSLTTAYDGITFFPGTGTMSGTIHVFGYEE